MLKGNDWYRLGLGDGFFVKTGKSFNQRWESENFLQQENAPNAYLIEVDDCFQGGSPVICFRK